MSTVPGPDTPAPPDRHETVTVSDAKSHDYGRLAAGGNAPAAGDGPQPAADAPPGETPSMSAYDLNWSGAAVDSGGTQAGANFGHGATQIVAQPDATGHPSADASGGGTVGDSGQQPARREVAPGEL